MLYKSIPYRNVKIICCHVTLSPNMNNTIGWTIQENRTAIPPIIIVYRYLPKTNSFFVIGNIPYKRSIPFFSEIENVYPDAIAIKHVAKETLVINERFIIANTTGISNVKQIAFTYTFTKSKSNFIAFIIFAISILLYL